MEYNKNEVKKVLDTLENEENKNVKEQNNNGNKKRKILKIAIFVVLILIIVKLFLSLIGNNSNYEKNSYHNTSGFSTKQFVQGKYLIIDNYSLYKKTKANIASQDEKFFSLNLPKFNRSFFLNNNLLAVICYENANLKSRIESFSEDGNNVNVTMYIDTHGFTADYFLDLYFIPIPKNIENVNVGYEFESYNDEFVAYKPIIYLYPIEDTQVSVKLKYNDNITVSYPKYSRGWNVLAKTNGTIIDLVTNKNLYALYYESKNTVDFEIEKDGFVVKGENVATFLEEKLAILGLNERETEEFIIYWLPILQENEYNYIRFATIDQINENMPLDITPNPDTIIRVLMTYKGLENPIEIEEQQLITPERNGFVAVEWGGTEIK